MAEIVNTFVSGMNRDTNPNSYDNKAYYTANNLRLVVDNELSTGTLTPINGVESSITWTSGYSLVGFTISNNYSFWFLSHNTLSIGVIYVIALNKFTTTVDITNVVNYSVRIYNASFNFSSRVEAVAKEETSDIVKLYWADADNNIRFCNVFKNGTGAWNSTDVNEFDILPDVTFNNMYFDDYTSGNLKSGAYQYTYCVYNKYESESLYLTPTPLIPVSNSNFNSGNSILFRGSASGEVTNKGIIIKLSNSTAPTGFDSLKVVRGYKATQEGTPEFTIVYDGAYTDTIIDTGSINLGSMIAEEIIMQSNLFKAETLETKNNYIFAGNIEDVPIEMDWMDDWDSRVYRFDVAQYAKQTDTTGENNAGFGIASGYPVIDGNVYTNYSTHRCNILTNDDTGDGNAIYQSDGATLGAEGANIKVDFITSAPYNIDDTSSTAVSRNNSSGLYIENFDRTGYQRSEIYRFGIVFFDDKGRHSFAKWIGDIRMPEAYDDDWTTEDNKYDIVYYKDPNNFKPRMLGLKFTVDTSSIPSNIVAFQIVRAVRTNADATVIDTGYLQQIKYNVTSKYTFHEYAGARDITDISSLYYEYVTGDNLYNKNTISQCDRLDIMGYSGADTAYAEVTQSDTSLVQNLNPDNILQIQRSKLNPAGANYSTTSTPPDTVVRKTNVLTEKITFKEDIDGTVNLFGKIFNRKVEYVDGATRVGLIGTSIIVNVGTAFLPHSTIGTNCYAPYTYRRKYTIPYGGTTPAAIANTKYIPCASFQTGTTRYQNNYVEISGGSDEIEVWGGDIYISNCEILRVSVDTENDNNYRLLNVVNAILESKINFNFTQNPAFNEIIPTSSSITEGSALKEFAGVHQYAEKENAPAYYTQNFDLYTYNPAYSIINNTVTYGSKPVDIEFQEDFPTRVYVSEKKLTGEFVDAWTKFRVNDFLDLSSEYGELIKLTKLQDRLIAVQERAVGTLPVEEKESISTDSASPLVVGIGGVLDRIDYIDTNTGTSLPRGAISTARGLYVIDNYNKKITRIGKNSEDISETKGIKSYIRGLDLDTGSVIYNPLTKELLFELDGENNKLIFSEITDTFIGFYTDSDLSGLISSFLYGGNLHYLTSTNGKKEASAYSLTPYLELLINPSNNKIVRYDSIAIQSYSDGSSLPLTSLVCEIQNGDTTSTLTSIDFKERMRIYRCNTLRDSSNNRLVSPYLLEKFTFANDTEFKVYDITTSFAPLNVK